MQKKRAFFLIQGLGQALSYGLLIFLGDLRKHMTWCQAGFFFAFFLYSTSLLLLDIRRDQRQSMPGKSQGLPSPLHQRFFLISILCFSVGFRVIVWFTPPTLSDDIYRYLWEGKILSLGFNPYAYPPSHPAFAKIRDPEVYPKINHKDFASIYPPLSLFLFSITTKLSPTIPAMKMTFLVFDLLTILILLLTLRALNLDLHRVIIYAWNPLVIMECAGSGHLDSAGIFFLVLALYLFVRHKTFMTTFFLSLSFLMKLLPIMFLPFVLRRKKVRNGLLFLLIAGVFYLPFLNAEDHIFRSLAIYSKNWVFNGSLYDVFVWTFHSSKVARFVSLSFFTVLLLMLAIRYQLSPYQEPKHSIYQIGFTALGGLFLLTPVLHPWYLCWIVPFLVIVPNRAWILFTGSIFLSYWVLKGYTESGEWEESSLIKVAEYVPFYCLLLFEAARNYRQQIMNKRRGFAVLFDPPQDRPS